MRYEEYNKKTTYCPTDYNLPSAISVSSVGGSEYPSEVIVEETVATEEGDYGW